jgi:hypothetical protein
MPGSDEGSTRQTGVRALPHPSSSVLADARPDSIRLLVPLRHPGLAQAFNH